MAANGRLTKDQLTRVQLGVRLDKRCAIAWKALQDDAKRILGRSIKVMPPGGGYRSFKVQDEMYRASHGNVALAKKWKLNPYSSVKLAAAGGSSYGFGTRVDVIGTVIDARFLALAAKHGFTREFGPADPNHFIWKG